MMDTIIEGNTYYRGRLVKCCVGIEDGKIVKIKKILSRGECETYYDFGDKLILPGCIDIHVHFREPGSTHKENFETGSLGAVFGGITCVFDMPNTVPAVTSMQILLEKLDIVRRKSYVDFGLYCEFTDEIDTSICKGVKLYSVSASKRNIPQDISKLSENVVVAMHCEDDRYFKKIVPRNLYEYHLHRPPISEIKAVEYALESGTPKLHVCHISTPYTLDIIRKFKSHFNVTTEVTPHHLFLNYTSEIGNFGKVNPPLRASEDNIALWNAFVSGDIDILASDHAPHTIPEKKENFNLAPPGVPGVETMVPVLLMKVRLNKLTISRLVEAVCEKPATLFTLKKGKIEIGYDADIVVLDMRNVKKIDENKLHTKCGWTPFDGFDAIFPMVTMVRGNIVIENHELVGDKGIGKFVYGDNRIFHKLTS